MKKGQVFIKKCKYCDVDFEFPIWKSPIYCSSQCKWGAQKTGIFGNYTNCLECKKSVTRECKTGYCASCYTKKNPYWLGKKRPEQSILQCGRVFSKEWRQRLSDSHIGIQAGSKSPNWKGGISSQPGYRNHIRSNYRIQKLGNGGFHTLIEWNELKAKFNYMCLCCKRHEPEIKLSKDHITPVSKGGTNNISNIQPLCNSCNSKKYNKTIDYISPFFEIRNHV